MQRLFWSCAARSCLFTVERIVVSAGGRKEVQLPNDQVTLNAFTASDADGRSLSTLPTLTVGHFQPLHRFGR